MTAAMREGRIAELNELMQEWGATRREALLDILYAFYEAAGFEEDQLSAELEVMSDDELMEAFLNI